MVNLKKQTENLFSRLLLCVGILSSLNKRLQLLEISLFSRRIDIWNWYMQVRIDTLALEIATLYYSTHLFIMRLQSIILFE